MSDAPPPWFIPFQRSRIISVFVFFYNSTILAQCLEYSNCLIILVELSYADFGK